MEYRVIRVTSTRALGEPGKRWRITQIEDLQTDPSFMVLTMLRRMMGIKRI